MKNFIIANESNKSRYKFEKIDILLKAQIENSLDLGWQINDIILLANFDYEFMGVKSTNISLNKECLTGSKMFGMKYLFDNNMIDDIIWAHDLDAWQNVSFSCPEFKEVGITTYSTSKYNGGSIFWKESARDIVEKIIEEININKENKEEPTLNKILKSKEYKNRVTNVNNTFNVGCSGYVKRWNRSVKPIRVCHFHPYNKTAWETHGLDRNGLDVIGVSDRLENILRKYYPDLAQELSQTGKIAQKERKEKRLEEKKLLDIHFIK
jgi:hypothetical protein